MVGVGRSTRRRLRPAARCLIILGQQAFLLLRLGAPSIRPVAPTVGRLGHLRAQLARVLLDPHVAYPQWPYSQPYALDVAVECVVVLVEGKQRGGGEVAPVWPLCA